MSPWALNRFSRAVSRGAVFAYPTDTIWGFGCHPLSWSGVSRILQIKNRPQHKGLILLSSTIEYCRPYLDISPEAMACIAQPMDSPTTWLVKASKNCPAWLCGNFPTIAIRISHHPFIQQICQQLESPIVSTSANRAGKSTVRNTIQLHRQFSAELDFIVHGFATGGYFQSEIRRLEDGIIIRNQNR